MEIYRELKGNFGTISRDSVIRASNYLVLTGVDEVDYASILSLELLRVNSVECKTDNDVSKYSLPEAYKTSLVMTINARSLQNFLELRSSKHALWEIQLLAKAMYEAIPDGHKFLFDNIIQS